MRDLALFRSRFSEQELAAKVQRFAVLSVCDGCRAESGNISNVTEEQMDEFMDILFPDGVETLEEEFDHESDGTVGVAADDQTKMIL